MSTVFAQTSHDNPTLREYALNELFNPSKNDLWTQYTRDNPGDEVTVSFDYWFQCMKSVVCRENVTKHPALFFKGIDNLTVQNQEVFKRLITKIPDEYLWVFLFARKVAVEPISNEFFFYFYEPSTAPVVVDRYTLAFKANSTTTVVVTEDTLVENLLPILNKWQAHLDQVVGKQFSYIHSSTLTSYFLNNFSLFITNSQVITSVQGEYSRPSECDRVGLVVSFNVANGYIFQGGTFAILFKEVVTKDYRRPLYSLLNYSTAATDLIEWPLVEKHEKNPVLYGVELECSFDYSIRELIDAQVEPFFIAKSDGSVTGSKKYKAELVTIPMSLKAHKKHWAHWFKNVDYSRFDCTKSTNNGIHVHIDKKAFYDDHHTKNMSWFYTNPANTDFLLYISERGTYEKMRTYSPIIKYPSSSSQVKSYNQTVRLASMERGIVNFGKKVTVEIRMFRSIVSFAELCKDLEFVDAVFHFCSGERSLMKLGFTDFLTWLQKEVPINKYTILRKFIDSCNYMDKMVSEYQIKNMIFNITEPELIIKKLNGSKLKLTNAHVSVLNKGIKRTYILNKDTGFIELTTTNMSKLAKIDRSTESRYTRNSF